MEGCDRRDECSKRFASGWIVNAMLHGKDEERDGMLVLLECCVAIGVSGGVLIDCADSLDVV